MTQVTEKSVWTRKSKRIGGAADKHTFRSHITFFPIPNWRVDLRECLKKKKKKIHFENFGDFCWICPLKSFNLRRFFRWALGSRGGHVPQMPPPLDTRLKSASKIDYIFPYFHYNFVISFSKIYVWWSGSYDTYFRYWFFNFFYIFIWALYSYFYVFFFRS